MQGTTIHIISAEKAEPPQQMYYAQHTEQADRDEPRGPHSRQPRKSGTCQNFRRIRDYGGIEAYMRLRVEEREKRTGKKLTIDDLP
jgi:hypothetical protein